MNWIKHLFHKETTPKYIKFFSVENILKVGVYYTDYILYYESIYGITSKGKTKLIRNTMAYRTKEEAKRESEMIIEILTNKLK